MCDSMGDRLKRYEMAEAGRYMMDGLYTIARLDGRAFHTFTRGMERPFDKRLQQCMADTTKELVQEFHADVGYTQSDEITLAWLKPMLFAGRYQKYQSVLAGFASTAFSFSQRYLLSEKEGDFACFDCRVFQVPNDIEAVNIFLWREDDAVKNSIQMAAQHYFSHKELHGKNRVEQMDMLHSKGVNWNDYPVHFKRGIYFQRKLVERPLSEVELARIPEKHREKLKGEKVIRGSVEVLDIPPLRELGAASLVLFPPEGKSGSDYSNIRRAQ